MSKIIGKVFAASFLISAVGAPLPSLSGVVPNVAACPWEGRQENGNCIVKGDVYFGGNTCGWSEVSINDRDGGTWCWIKQ